MQDFEYAYPELILNYSTEQVMCQVAVMTKRRIGDIQRTIFIINLN